jgi:FlaA1/EpsC-like NDP-sugar epimerase
MGKSKLITEIIVNKMMHLEKISLSIVRFGNVLNSSGSVLSIFEQQIKNGGPLTVTDKNATRFFMSIPEAAQLIIQSSAIKSKYNTFILEMGEPYNIYELAKKMIQINGFNIQKDQYNQGIEINITGLKPEEKLHEELSIKSENLKKTIHPKIYGTKEEYAQFDVYEFIKELKDFYNNGEEDKFKRTINTLIDAHHAIN